MVLTLDRDDAVAARRLAAVAGLGVLDRIGDPVLTALTRLAQAITGAESAAVHIFDDDYQRRVAASGTPLGEHPAEDSMCRLVVRSGTRIVTADATQDEQFACSSYVKDPVTPVRFYASVPLTVGGGVAVGTLCAFGGNVRDLTAEQVARLEDIAAVARAHLELVRLAEDLGHAATSDPLTGAVNRAIFDDRVAQALARRRRRQGAVMVALIDLDRFKSINDTYGHATGDEALAWVAERLRHRLRDEDTVGRLGGDEFAVVAEVGEPTQVALEALRRELERAPEGFEPAFTVSVGAVLVEDDDDGERVLRRADEAMYAVKQEHHRRDGLGGR